MLHTLWPASGRVARAMRCIAAALAIVSLAATHAAAGPGHSGDEGHSHDGPSSASAQSARVTASSEALQLVGILKGGKLTIYLDREPDNAPVTGARITVTAGGSSVDAAAGPDSTYEIAAGEWAKPGENEMQFAISVGDRNDLLGGVLIVPATSGKAAASQHSHGHGHDLKHLVSHLPPLRQMIGGALLLGLGLVIGGLLVRRRNGVTAGAMAVVALSLALAPAAVAGPGHAGDEGHSHGPEAGAGLSDAASRLPDGSVFVPKPTQRLIEVRTGLVALSEARRHVHLPGRVVGSASGPLVDVALYDQADPDAIRVAHAVAPSGARTEIRLAERGLELRQIALPLKFTMDAAAPAALRAVGQRLTVILETGEPIRGIVLPRAAVVTAPNGQSVVFEHIEPEKFTPRPVLFSGLDPDRVIVTSGIAAGDKIVLRAAALINQIR